MNFSKLTLNDILALIAYLITIILNIVGAVKGRFLAYNLFCKKKYLFKTVTTEVEKEFFLCIPIIKEDQLMAINNIKILKSNKEIKLIDEKSGKINEEEITNFLQVKYSFEEKKTALELEKQKSIKDYQLIALENNCQQYKEVKIKPIHLIHILIIHNLFLFKLSVQNEEAQDPKNQIKQNPAAITEKHTHSILSDNEIDLIQPHLSQSVLRFTFLLVADWEIRNTLQNNEFKIYKKFKKTHILKNPIQQLSWVLDYCEINAKNYQQCTLDKYLPKVIIKMDQIKDKFDLEQINYSNLNMEIFQKFLQSKVLGISNKLRSGLQPSKGITIQDVFTSVGEVKTYQKNLQAHGILQKLDLDWVETGLGALPSFMQCVIQKSCVFIYGMPQQNDYGLDLMVKIFDGNEMCYRAMGLKVLPQSNQQQQIELEALLDQKSKDIKGSKEGVIKQKTVKKIDKTSKTPKTSN